MSADGGQIEVSIALMGADEFDSGVQQITGDLGQLQSAAQEASGDSGLGGFGSASSSAAGSTSGLSSNTRDLSTAVGALGGSLSATVGGVINMQSSQLSLEAAHDRVNRATTAVEKAQNTYNSTLAKYGGTADSASKSTKELSDAQDKLNAANEKVARDYETIQKDEDRINKLRAEGKTNTAAYSEAVTKLQTDMGQLATDQGKAKDAQAALNQAHQDFNDKAAPAVGMGADKIKAAYDSLQDKEATLKRAQKDLQIAQEQAWLSTAQTVIGAVGSISSSIGIFGKLFKDTKTTTDEFGNSATSIGTNWGKLIGTGGVLTAVGIGLYAIGTNALGVRTSMEQWWSSISQNSPILDGFGHLIHGIAADLGLTGTGIMSGQDEISQAINSIHAALQQTNIGKDLDDLSKKFQQFLKDPFGNNAQFGPVSGPQQIFGITNKPDTFFAPGIGRNITLPGPNAQVIGQAPSNAQQLADSILKVITDGVDLVNKALSPGGQYQKIIHTIWDKVIADINDQGQTSTQTGRNPGQQAGFDFLGGFVSYLQGKEAQTKAQKPFWDLINNIATTGPLGPAGPNNDQLGQIAAGILKKIFEFGQGAGGFIGQATGGKDILAGVVDSIGNALFGSKEWGNMGTKFSNALASIFGGGADQHGNVQGGLLSGTVEKIFGPMFNASNWTQFAAPAMSALQSVFKWTTQTVGTVIGGLFTASNWTQFGTNAMSALTGVFKWTTQTVSTVISGLFTASNWTQFGTNAMTALTGVFKWTTQTVSTVISGLFTVSNWTQFGTNAMSAITSVFKWTSQSVYTVMSGLFNFANWQQLYKDAQGAIISALTILGKDVAGIFSALGDTSNWGKVADNIKNAIYNAILSGAKAAMDFLARLPQQAATTLQGIASGLSNAIQGGFNALAGAGGGQTATHAALSGQPVTVNAPVSSNATLTNQPVIINMQVNGRTLAQVMAQFNTGTSAFA
jgi:hypothetical protein